VLSVVATSVIVANFTGYPAFGDRGVVMPHKIESQPRVEATIDRGPIVEMVIRCDSGTAINSCSKMDRRYCSPKHLCDRSIATVLAKTC
jgi:hypothetical protein